MICAIFRIGQRGPEVIEDPAGSEDSCPTTGFKVFWMVNVEGHIWVFNYPAGDAGRESCGTMALKAVLAKERGEDVGWAAGNSIGPGAVARRNKDHFRTATVGRKDGIDIFRGYEAADRLGFAERHLHLAA
jgi:hypothetical protein